MNLTHINHKIAVDSGGLLNSIRAKKRGMMRVSVSAGKKYAARLDNKNKLNRPFFRVTAENYRAKFKQNLINAMKEAI